MIGRRASDVRLLTASDMIKLNFFKFTLGHVLSLNVTSPSLGGMRCQEESEMDFFFGPELLNTQLNSV